MASLKTTEHTKPQTVDYRTINRSAYDALAEKYRARQESDREKDLQLIQPFIRLLHKQFGNHPIRVIDLGCGNGLNLSMFADAGFEVAGIDISERMLAVAHETCPSAKLIREDFLVHPFLANCYQGVFAKAIIHLFPKPDALKLLLKVHDILKPGGVFYVTTTVENSQFEGLLEKSDYDGQVSRYRKIWTEEELTSEVLNSGFQIAETSYNQEYERGKRWFNIWAIKQPIK